MSLHLPRKGHRNMPDNSLLFPAGGLKGSVMRLCTFHAEVSSVLLIPDGIHVPKQVYQKQF